MAQLPQHTYGAKCRLAHVPKPVRDDGVPPLEAQFFYSSAIPIDEPLSIGSQSNSVDNTSAKCQARPFGKSDNNALEKAWLSLASDEKRRHHFHLRTTSQPTNTTNMITDQKVDRIVQSIAEKHIEKHKSTWELQDMTYPENVGTLPGSRFTCCTMLLLELSEELGTNFCAFDRQLSSALNLDLLASRISTLMEKARVETIRPTEAAPAGFKSPYQAKTPTYSPNQVSQEAQATNPNPKTSVRERDKVGGEVREVAEDQSSFAPAAPECSSTTGHQAVGSSFPIESTSSHYGISGTPFARVGDARSGAMSLPHASVRHSAARQGKSSSKDTARDAAKTIGLARGATYAEEIVEVAVGVSRLHMVSLPSLQMKPIYWSPINDLAAVIRATWFYRDTMQPVAPTIANQIEAGYQELRPWSETWEDEIRCAVDVGPAGEEKVSHPLWLPEHDSRDRKGNLNPPISTDSYCAARCFRGDAAAEGTIPSSAKHTGASEKRAFASHHVIYKNETEAYLLKPSLRPSAYYGRRPIQKITKGITIGVPVVRGFDRGRWKQNHNRAKKPETAAVSGAGESHENSGRNVCAACKLDVDRRQAKDLVLVAHGIGQKFAERVESFHFTHAINSFRRSVNMELATPTVQKILRHDHNGLMILPLNWRMGLSFEDGGFSGIEHDERAPGGFGLKDIEPDTIPAVRSVISDVMFDIPFYMSHHKAKMIRALVAEANRVYRLWCRNNPGFVKNGRVHLIGHSLGSAMAIDILSRQPTFVSRLDDAEDQLSTEFFEFDTRNLFLVGSPAGFFLLLERGMLMPRRGRHKPGADPLDPSDESVTAVTGSLGCIAVDNIYNILAKEDPIAYLLNGAVDPHYAASLQKAFVPSASSTLLQAVSKAIWNVFPGTEPATDSTLQEPARPANIRLPSQLELEVHDFTREEIAEKRAYLLNDNGQIDWFLRSSGGPLELQYLNMLSAHTSYWSSPDFIRFLCLEVGRSPGKANTIPALRAVKNSKFTS